MSDNVIINNNLIHEVCPLCHSRLISSIGKSPRLKECTFSSSRINLKYLSELWRCRECKSGFIQYAVTKEDAECLYEKSNSSARWASSKRFEDQKTEDIASIMKDIFSSAQSVLDIGCNTGELLDYAKSFDCSTYGLEVSKPSALICSGKGHNIISGLDTCDHRYDVITAFDVIEHLHEVNEFLEKCSKALTPSGKLVLLTGNFNSLPARLARNKWWYIAHPEHIIFPSLHFFSALEHWTMMNYLYCFNGKSWIFPRFRLSLSSALRIFTNRYTGYPSLWPDHMLIILQPK